MLLETDPVLQMIAPCRLRGCPECRRGNVQLCHLQGWMLMGKADSDTAASAANVPQGDWGGKGTQPCGNSLYQELCVLAGDQGGGIDRENQVHKGTGSGDILNRFAGQTPSGQRADSLPLGLGQLKIPEQELGFGQFKGIHKKKSRISFGTPYAMCLKLLPQLAAKLLKRHGITIYRHLCSPG